MHTGQVIMDSPRPHRSETVPEQSTVCDNKCLIIVSIISMPRLSGALSDHHMQWTAILHARFPHKRTPGEPISWVLCQVSFAAFPRPSPLPVLSSTMAERLHGDSPVCSPLCDAPYRVCNVAVYVLDRLNSPLWKRPSFVLFPSRPPFDIVSLLYSLLYQLLTCRVHTICLSVFQIYHFSWTWRTHTLKRSSRDL